VFMENCWDYQRRLSRLNSVLNKTALRNNRQTWTQDVCFIKKRTMKLNTAIKTGGDQDNEQGCVRWVSRRLNVRFKVSRTADTAQLWTFGHVCRTDPDRLVYI